MAIRGIGWVEALLDDVRGAYQRLSARERLAISALTGVVALFVLVGSAYWLLSATDELSSESQAMREALRDLERYREPYQQVQQQQQSLAQRIPAAALELNEFLEGVAAAAGVKIDESNETAVAELGPYRRSGLEVKLRKVTIGQLGKLLGRIGAATQALVQVRELNVSTRWGRPEELDVELVVATYSRRAPKAAVKGALRAGG